MYALPYSRMPQLFTKDIALVQQFFESMCKVSLTHSFEHIAETHHDSKTFHPPPPFFLNETMQLFFFVVVFKLNSVYLCVNRKKLMCDWLYRRLCL